MPSDGSARTGCAAATALSESTATVAVAIVVSWRLGRNTPITGKRAGWARAASGQAAAPPSSDMNARRFMCGRPPPGKRKYRVPHRSRLQSCVRPVHAVRMDCRRFCSSDIAIVLQIAGLMIPLYLVCELNGNARWRDAQHLISECSLSHRSCQSLYPATTCVNHASSTAEIFVHIFHPCGDLIPTVVRGGITLSGLAHRSGQGRIPGQPADGRA
jgi:hypothetical protein